MTLAICISCGAHKFGAFVPCEECGFEPTDLADKAKSLTLSDHNFPPVELDKFSQALQSHEVVPFDSITLAAVARPIAEENYYWEHLGGSASTLPCMRCGANFRPTSDEVSCPLCRAETEEPLSICVRCSLIFDSEAKHCQDCGARVGASSQVTVKSLAADMGRGVGRMIENKDPLAKSTFLAGVRKKQSKEEGSASRRELMIVGLYCGLLVLSKSVVSSVLLFRIKQEIASLYGDSHALRGADVKTVDFIRSHCLQRWDEYTSAVARDPQKWGLLIGSESAKNCFGVENHVGAAMDMMIFISGLSKVLQAGVIGSTIQREVNKT